MIFPSEFQGAFGKLPFPKGQLPYKEGMQLLLSKRLPRMASCFRRSCGMADSIAVYVRSCRIHVDTLTLWHIGEYPTTSEDTLTHTPLPLYWHISLMMHNFVSPPSVFTILQCFLLVCMNMCARE